MGIEVSKSILAATLMTVLLAGCDSGSESKQTYEGGAFKGLLQNAKVEIYEVENGSPKAEPTATVYTEADGKYQFDTSSLGEVTLVRVSGRSDEVTLMQCDLAVCGDATDESVDTNTNGKIEFGEWLHVGSDFELTGYFVDWVSTEVPTVNLLTHVVAETVTSFSKENLAGAYSDVQEAMGLTTNPAMLPVLDVSKPLTEDDMDALKVSALLSLVETAEGSDTSLAARLDAITDAENQSILPTSEDFSLYQTTIATLELSELGETSEELSTSLAQNVNERAEEEGALPLELLPPDLPPLL